MSGLFDDLITPETLAGVRAKVIGYAQAADLLITNWIVGGVGQQIFESVTQTTYQFTQVVVRAVRGFASLDTSTDPGDPDDFDPTNEALTPAAGYLSWFGENTFGTVREGATFASGKVTFVNAGIAARTFAPGGLVFTWTEGTPPSPAPTYRNAPDPSIYVNVDGTVTVAAGAQIDLPVTAEEIGTRSNAPPGTLSLTTTLVGCSATNAAAILGTDREDAATYRTRCRQAPARISLGGPSAAYAYFATKNLDGTPLVNGSGNPVVITRVWVSPESTTGIVDVYYASATGGAPAEDVTAANDNIEAECFAVPDAITFTGQTAIETAIHVAGTAKLKRKVGMTDAALQAAAAGAIVDALGAAFATFDIGGKDQVEGAGVIYTVDLQTIAGSAYAGLYDLVATAPAGATTAIAKGHVATLTSVAADWTITVVP